jgi:enamine deaminase RidA (YjgF/YER057c/UK114 family)
VNYGLLGDNLPSPDKVISLYKSRGIRSLRLFNPDQNALNALKGSGIYVILGTLNQDLERLASNQSYAATWVQTNVAPFSGSVHFKYIDAGNEVIPGDLAVHVLPAMRNLDAALKDAGFNIPVTTAVSTQVCFRVFYFFFI